MAHPGPSLELPLLMMGHRISRLLCFAPWMISLSLLIDFDDIHATLCTVYGRSVLFCCIFFVDADLLQLQLYVYDVPDASTSVSDAVFNTIDAFLNCCIGC